MVKSGMAAAFFLLIGSSYAYAQCSNATLNGDYSFTVHGQSLSADGTTSTGLIDGVGYISFDGNGNASQEDFVVKNGAEVPGLMPNTIGFHSGETGTYSVADDCSATLEITLSPGNTRTEALVIGGRGTVLHGVVSAATANGTAIVLQVFADFQKTH